LYDVEITLKKFFNSPEEIKYFNARTKRALVMRSFVGSTNQYELRVTLNNLTFNEVPTPLESGGIIYQDIVTVPNMDSSDGQAFDIKVINTVSTI
jgi:hypothetical protein